MNIAIQGQPGSFHDTAAQRFFTGTAHSLVCCETFSDVFARVENGSADYGIVAVENSLYGSLHETYDRIARHQFPVVGEIVLAVHQQLIALPGVTLTDITEIISHPAALDQCRSYLETTFPNAELVEFHDTAGAVKHIKTEGLHSAAAIASETAALLYDVPILARDIEDEPDNMTRFVVVAKQPRVVLGANKASLILVTSHQPGALHRALGTFSEHSCNLTKLESRPIRGELFRYQFIIDVLVDQTTLIDVTVELEQQGCRVTLLGHYRADQ